ncbi:TauD/TfdA family dioxygenase [Sphingorhabdus sp. Alg239-R122]|uniref:TauD/TfdA family dioxygenase n=1 Tax=Sphingorhabdus sp. Alg239-R122 TaxID=2305989 RepID=UPI0013D919E3|nr:TauD/TfdA family dioxygenase [Sphingorhabdus sp. Alg239-R122]
MNASLHFSTGAHQQQWSGAAFPAIVMADGSDALADIMATHQTAIDAALAETGAILFRGFGISDADDFDHVVTAYGAENFPYAKSLSNAVRINLTPRVFTANEAPPETSIYLHHEMAQTPIYPSRLFFFCEIAADKGGATPLCRSDMLLSKLDAKNPSLVKRFRERGVRYTNIMPPENDTGSGQGRSWRSTLGVDTHAEAEARLAALCYTGKWLGGDTLKATTPVLDAVRIMPDGRHVFFNQLIAAFRGWADSRNDPSKSITYGDGSAIDPADMALAINIANDISYDLNWQSGDVALVDNFLVMHGRRPFQGKRRVLASLIK